MENFNKIDFDGFLNILEKSKSNGTRIRHRERARWSKFCQKENISEFEVAKIVSKKNCKFTIVESGIDKGYYLYSWDKQNPYNNYAYKYLVKKKKKGCWGIIKWILLIFVVIIIILTLIIGSSELINLVQEIENEEIKQHWWKILLGGIVLTLMIAGWGGMAEDKFWNKWIVNIIYGFAFLTALTTILLMLLALV